MPAIVTYDSEQVVLLVTGDEDRTTSGLRRRALSAALHAPRDICVDLSQLRFADPSLMLDLAVLAQRLRAEGRALRLRAPQPQVRTLISLVGSTGSPPWRSRRASRSRNVRGARCASLLLLLFIVVPIAELAVIIQVGEQIGVWWTIALLIADSILGSMLMRSQGRIAWRRFNEALQAGRPPAREVLDGVLVIFGGALLLTPGFITDILGLVLLIPPTRALVRRRARAPLRRPHDRVGDARARAGPAAAAGRRTRATSRARRSTSSRDHLPRGTRVSEPVLTGGEGFTDAVTALVRRPRRRASSGSPARASSRGPDGACRAARSACCSPAASRSGWWPRAAPRSTPARTGASCACRAWP